MDEALARTFRLEAIDESLSRTFRKCQNIKSRTNPDVQCPFSATHGEYCSRHHNNPRPFKHIAKTSGRIYTRGEHICVKKIQSFWRRRSPLNRYHRQGPAANALDLAMNDTELYTLDPVKIIPKTYLISFSDERKCIWVFDIRTLVHSMATGFASQNPYTRDTLTELTTKRVHARIEWLRKRKYAILHVSTDTLTVEQGWNQKVLDIFLKIESLGYYVNCDWYHSLSVDDHMRYYKMMYDLWEWRLGLTRAAKERIIPGHLSTGSQRLFSVSPDEALRKGRHWWEKKNLSLIEAFITRSTDKEQNKIGAMYILMGLVHVSPPAATALPWLLETLGQI